MQTIMNAAPGETSAFAIDLDRRQSRRLIEHALRACAEVSLWPNAQPDDRPVTAPLAGHTSDGLILHPDRGADYKNMPMVSEYCEASFRLDDARFMFSTNVLDLARADDAWRLEIAKPTHLQVVQRRRYRRRGLRENTAVRITAAENGHREAAEAALLNIGIGGLACRTDQADADSFPIEAAIEVSFTLSESERPFELIGHVRGKTRGARPEHVILAVEFAAAHVPPDEIERLSHVLYGPVPAGAQR